MSWIEFSGGFERVDGKPVTDAEQNGFHDAVVDWAEANGILVTMSSQPGDPNEGKEEE